MRQALPAMAMTADAADSEAVPAAGQGERLFATVVPVLKPTEVAQLLRSVAMLPPGCPAGLDRETAYAVLAQLEDLQTRRRRSPYYVLCPYCSEGFDIAHGLRATPGHRTAPPRHPDPIEAASSVGGAEAAARALAKAWSWRDERLQGPDAFWVDFGRTVLWPVLYLARARGRDIDDVKRLLYPEGFTETLGAVSAELGALEPGIDVDRARRQWKRIVETDARAQRMAFGFAYGMVDYWDMSAAWPGPARAAVAGSGIESEPQGGKGEGSGG